MTTELRRLNRKLRKVTKNARKESGKWNNLNRLAMEMAKEEERFIKSIIEGC